MGHARSEVTSPAQREGMEHRACEDPPAGGDESRKAGEHARIRQPAGPSVKNQPGGLI